MLLLFFSILMADSKKIVQYIMESNKKSVIVDVQFVVGNNKQMFVKELVTLNTDSINPVLYHFKPPFPQEELNPNSAWQSDYNYKFINGLTWSNGVIDYNHLPEILSTLEGSVIYLKGEEKAKVLKKYLKDVEIIQADIPKLGLLKKYKTNCILHGESPNVRCALENTVNMYMYLLKNKIIE